MPVAINPPSLNIDAPNKFLSGSSGIWSVLKVIGIIAVIVIIIMFLTLGIVLLIRAFLPKKTPQHNITSDKAKSCKATKRGDIKYVYRYDTKGLHKVGDYLGETSDMVNSIEVTTIYVGHPKELGFLPRAVHNFVWKINFLYSVPTKSTKVMIVEGKPALVLLASTFKYDGQLKIFVAQDHTGLPKKVVEVFLDDVHTEYLHNFVKKTQEVMDRAIEVNPYVVAELKRKKEMEEGEDD